MDILAVTDASFLYEVFIAIGLVFNHADYVGMISLGLVLGLLFTMLRAWTTSKLEVHYIFIGMVIYLGFIVPKVSVDIEDMQSPTTVYTTPTNIPLGVAVIGSIMSTISLNIVETMETSFSTPGMLDQNGFLGTLKRLEAIAKGAEQAPDYIKRTLSAYYSDCTHIGLTIGANSYDDIIMSNDPLGSIEFPSDVYMTKQVNSSGVVSTVTCSDAYTFLTNELSDATFLANWGAKIGEITAERAAGSDVFDVSSDMEQAIDGVIGSASTALQNATASLVLYGVISGDTEYAAQTNNTTMIAMLSDATKQRNADAYGAAIGFQQVMRPFSAFVEAFFFAITPLTAFFLMLGAFGVAMLGKYLQLYAWIQMWTPMMAIVNFFINYRLKDSIDSLTCSSGTCNFPEIGSIASIDAITNTVGHWLYVGNTMASAVPILALILVTGSVYSINSVASSMSGKDYTDEKKVAPDIFSTNAGKASAGGNMAQYNSYGGITDGYGALQDQLGRTLGVNAGFNKAVSTGELAQAAASQVLANNVTEAIAARQGFASDMSTTQDFNDRISAGGTRTYDAFSSLVKGLADSKAIQGDAKQLESLTTALTANAGVNAELFGGLNVGASASYIKQQAEQLGLTTSSGLKSDIQNQFGDKETLGAFIRSEGGYSDSDIKKLSATLGYSSDGARQLSDNYQETLQRARTASSSIGTQQALSTASNLTYAELAATAAASWGAENGYDVDTVEGRRSAADMYKLVLQDASLAATKGEVGDYLALANLLRHSPMFAEFESFMPTTRPFDIGDVSIPHSDRSTSDLSSKDLGISNQIAQRLGEAEQVMGPGGGYENVRSDVQQRIPDSTSDARRQLEGRFGSEQGRVDGFAGGNYAEYDNLAKKISDPQTISQIMSDVKDNDANLTEATDKAAGDIATVQPEMASAVTDAISPTRMNNAVSDTQNRIRELVAYALTQDGQIAKESDTITVGNYGFPRHIDQSYSSNVPGRTPSQLIESAASTTGQGALAWVAQVTALGDIYEENGLAKPQATGLTPALLGNKEVWEAELQGKQTKAGEPITMEMISARVSEDWQRYPDTYSEYMFAPGSGQKANMTGRNEDLWSTLSLPVAGYTPTDPELLKDSKSTSMYQSAMINWAMGDFGDESQLGENISDMKEGVREAYMASVFNEVLGGQVNNVPWGVRIENDVEDLPQQ